MEFFRQEYWSRLPLLTPGDLPDPGIEPTSLVSPTLARRFSITSATWKPNHSFSSVQLLSYVQLFATPWTIACQASLSITNSQSLPKSMSIKSMMPSNHLILCHPLLLLPSIFPSIRVFFNESALHMEFQLQRQSFQWTHPGLISFRVDWLDLLAVQGTLKSLLQHHSPKASILWCSAFFIVQLSHRYMATGKTIALTRWTFYSP